MSRTQPFSSLVAAQLLEIAGLEEPVEHAKRGFDVSTGAAHHDRVRAVGLNGHLVSCFEPGADEGFDGERHLVLARDPRHAFTIS